MNIKNKFEIFTKNHPILLLSILIFVISSCGQKNSELEGSRINNMIEVSRKNIIDVINNIENVDNVNVKSVYGETALMLASESGNIQIVRKLIFKGAEINAREDGGQTPLMYASIKGHVEVVRELISKGADINAKQGKGYTALIYASKLNHLNVVQELISKGADVNSKVHDTDIYDGATAYWFVSDYLKEPVAYNALEPIRKALVKAGAKTQIQVFDKQQLMRAVERGDLAMVTNMIENLGADVNARCSAKVSSSSSVSSSGATLTTINTAGLTVAGQGNSALSLAILNAHVEIVRYLVNKDADVNITVIYEDSSVINKRKGESLLNLNASDFVSIPEKKATILQLAERSGNADIIEIIRSKHK